jgi:hypothetical protein
MAVTQSRSQVNAKASGAEPMQKPNPSSWVPDQSIEDIGGPTQFDYEPTKVPPSPTPKSITRARMPGTSVVAQVVLPLRVVTQPCLVVLPPLLMTVPTLVVITKARRNCPPRLLTSTNRSTTPLVSRSKNWLTSVRPRMTSK